MESNNWPQAHSDALRDCFAKGMSFGEIARELNLRFGTRYTRSAVLGRGKRIGLAPREPGVRTGFIPAPASARAMGHARRRAALDWATPSKAAYERAEPVTLRCVGVAPRLLPLVELEPGDCRYPYGGEKDGEGIVFCAHPVRPHSNYCQPHFELTRSKGRGLEPPPLRPVTLRLVTRG